MADKDWVKVQVNRDGGGGRRGGDDQGRGGGLRDRGGRHQPQPGPWPGGQDPPILRDTEFFRRAAKSAGGFPPLVFPLMVRIDSTGTCASIFVSTKETYGDLCADLQRIFQLQESIKAVRII